MYNYTVITFVIGSMMRMDPARQARRLITVQMTRRTLETITARMRRAIGIVIVDRSIV